MNPSNRPPTTRTSFSAVKSFVFGIMSPVVLCGVFSTTITSLLAIILGHIALVRIKRGQGAVFGRWQAITGLVLGYLLLPVSLCLIPGYLKVMKDGGQASSSQDSSSNLMAQAELQISSDRDGFAHGNSPEAVALAREFSQTISTAINSVIVEERKSGEQKSIDEQFDVFCQINPESVCFLAKVPRYRKYQDDARKALNEIAWIAGTSVVENSNLPKGIDLGIGLKGNFVFGTMVSGPSNLKQPAKILNSSVKLHEYFPVANSKETDF